MSSFESEVTAVGARLDQVSGAGSDRIVVVVLTWNSRDYVHACLESIVASTVPVAVLVVDNDSHDGTPTEIRKRWKSAVTIIETGVNLGYAGGNNIGMAIAAAAMATSVLLVNPDAILSPTCVEELTAVLNSSSDIGLVSPAICYSGTDVLWYAGSEIDRVNGSSYHLGEGDRWHGLPSDPFDTGRASGCVVAVNPSTVADVGGLDERYFLYYEEAEWSLRMRQHQLRVVVVPTVRAWHAVGHGRGGASLTYQYYMTRNRLLMVSGHGVRGVRGALPRSIRDSLVSLMGTARTDPLHLWGHLAAVLHGYIDFARGRFGPRGVSSTPQAAVVPPGR